MKRSEAYHQFEENLFYGKNKEYGAYVLRKKQKSAQIKGSLIGIFSISLLYLLPFIVKAVDDYFSEDEKLKLKQELKVVNYSQLSSPPPIEMINEPKPPPKIDRVLSSKKFLPPVVKPDEEVPDEELIPTQDELENINPGTETVEGIDSVVLEGQMVVQEPPKQEMQKAEEVFQFVEDPPDFPGGDAGLMEFLRSNLRYPDVAKDVGIEGTVVVQFVISSQGKINEILIVKGIGGGCDEETVRVLQVMPDWKPGTQNGRAVAVRYILPVRFRLKTR